MCAVQPVMLAMTKIGVKNSISKPRMLGLPLGTQFIGNMAIKMRLAIKAVHGHYFTSRATRANNPG